jgi:putative ABC transport system permease protein
VGGVAITATGAAILAIGLASFKGALVGGGGLLFLVGMAVLAVPLARPLAWLIGAPLARLGGMAGRLGRANAMRNPRRTAATAAALTIGLAMIVTRTVTAASQKATAGAAVRKLAADYQLAAGNQPDGTDPFGSPDGPVISRVLLDELARRPEVTGVTGRWSLAARLPARRDWPGVALDAVLDPGAFQRVAGLELVSGRMSGDGLAIRDDLAAALGVSPGSRLQVEIPQAGTPEVLVAAVFADPQRRTSPLVVSLDRITAAVPSRGVPVAYVQVAGGATRDAMEWLTRADPTLVVRDRVEQQRFQERQINQVLYLMYALLGLAMVIGLLGIVNTLALSMVDRVRELGLLRAIGMDRRQLRAMIRAEALIIATLGGLLGLAIGVLFGWAVASRLMRLATFALPVAQLVALMVAAAASGVLAAVLPARWAARIDVLRAIAAG